MKKIFLLFILIISSCSSREYRVPASESIKIDVVFDLDWTRELMQRLTIETNIEKTY